MSATTSEDVKAETDKSEDKSEAAGYTPPATQEDLNKIIAERVKREREKYANHAELEAKAKKLDEIEEANKTELDKANARADAAEKERDTIRADKLRLEIASKHGITGEYLDLLSGSTEEELEATAAKVAALIPAQDADTSGVRELVVSGEGKSPAALNSDALTSMLSAAVGASPGANQ
jgi:hypothetical protein